MKQSILYGVCSAILTALVLLIASPASAQTGASDVRTHVSVVPTADLDLGTDAGQRQLQQRLARAARTVCGEASEADLRGRNEVRKCRGEAIARAASQRGELLAAKGGSAIAVTAKR